jgi:DUF1365 family protein
MKPQLCTGSVMHARFATGRSPVAHSFVYPLFFLALPLSQLQDAGNRWFGIERARPLSLRFRDHGARDGSPPEPWIRRLLATEGITAADGEVVLQTFPRIFGFVFNPVSFWFCMTARAPCAPCWRKSATPSATTTTTSSPMPTSARSRPPTR